jgi:hypothetical protein
MALSSSRFNWEFNRESGDFSLSLEPELPLMARLNGPAVCPADLIARCKTYRDAVRMCFAYRRVKGMNRKTVAELAGIHVPHISDYLSDDDTKREMPARYIPDFEDVCGNTCISQWIALQAQLTVMEEMQVRRRA